MHKRYREEPSRLTHELYSVAPDPQFMTVSRIEQIGYIENPKFRIQFSPSLFVALHYKVHPNRTRDADVVSPLTKRIQNLDVINPLSLGLFMSRPTITSLETGLVVDDYTQPKHVFNAYEVVGSVCVFGHRDRIEVFGKGAPHFNAGYEQAPHALERIKPWVDNDTDPSFKAECELTNYGVHLYSVSFATCIDMITGSTSAIWDTIPEIYNFNRVEYNEIIETVDISSKLGRERSTHFDIRALTDHDIRHCRICRTIKPLKQSATVVYTQPQPLGLDEEEDVAEFERITAPLTKMHAHLDDQYEW